MADEELSKQKLQEIADALDRVVSDLPWQQSVFLKALGKKFETIRDEFVESSGLKPKEAATHAKKDPFALKDDEIEVYVALYNAQGTDLKQWAKIISNISTLSISRPTYSTEQAVREMIRSSANILNEGYVSVHIHKGDIIAAPEDRAPRDKLGNILLMLKENIITVSDVRKFYHKSGIYTLKKGELERIADMNLSEE